MHAIIKAFVVDSYSFKKQQKLFNRLKFYWRKCPHGTSNSRSPTDKTAVRNKKTDVASLTYISLL
jgi:hypothetical protein